MHVFKELSEETVFKENLRVWERETDGVELEMELGIEIAHEIAQCREGKERPIRKL